MRRTEVVAPIVVGNDTPTQGPPHACVACGTDVAARVPAVLGEIGAAVLCRDAAAGCARYRGGASPASYGAALRGELLAVAP